MMSKISKVNTVTGLVSPSELGKTLIHEHVLLLRRLVCQLYVNAINREACIKTALDTIKGLKTYGVDTVVDCTPMIVHEIQNFLKRFLKGLV